MLAKSEEIKRREIAIQRIETSLKECTEKLQKFAADEKSLVIDEQKLIAQEKEQIVRLKDAQARCNEKRAHVEKRRLDIQNIEKNISMIPALDVQFQEELDQLQAREALYTARVKELQEAESRQMALMQSLRHKYGAARAMSPIALPSATPPSTSSSMMINQSPMAAGMTSMSPRMSAFAHLSVSTSSSSSSSSAL